MKKTTLACLGAAFLAAGHASATVIVYAGGDDPTDGPAGNSVVESADGITVTATAWSLLGGSGPWTSSYLGQYEHGLGVTNPNETDHTVDNYGSIDGVAFSFSSAVALQAVALYAIADTDVTIWYNSGGGWTFLENDYAGTDSRVAYVNDGGMTASEWMVSARDLVSTNSTPLEFVDRVKIWGIKFDGGSPPGGRVPDTGGGLLLLGIGLGALRLVTLKRKK